jgi:hypothetical protein
MSDIFTFFVFPIFLSGLLVWLDENIIRNFSELIITSLSIFIGLLFSLLTLIFDLAKKEKEKLVNETVNHIEKASFTLIKEIFVNISYSIILSILCIISVFVSQFRPVFFIEIIKKTNYFMIIKHAFFFFTNAIVVFLLIQFVFTLLMILKRFFIIFNKQIETEV